MLRPAVFLCALSLLGFGLARLAHAPPPHRPPVSGRAAPTHAPYPCAYDGGYQPTATGFVPTFHQNSNQNTFGYLGCMMVQTFVALNWPADSDAGRGVALAPDGGVAVLGSAPGGPRAWETWKQDWETLGADAATSWDSYAVATPPCDVLELEDGGLTTVDVGNWPDLYRRYGGAVLDKINLAAQEPDGGLLTAGPLIDPGGNYYQAETRFNQPIYNCWNSGWGNGCQRDGGLQLPPGSATQVGALSVRTIWRPLANTSEKDTYHFRDSLVVGYEQAADGGIRSVCREETMLLVGMHVVYKDPDMTCTTGAGTPCNQWVWSTFEQTDGTGPCDGGLGPDAGPGYSYMPRPLSCGNLPQSGALVQECRLNSIPVAASNLNDFLQSLPPPWSHYKLVNIQWMMGSTPSPGPVANLRLEAYAQTASCMGCHGAAHRTDFSWSLSLGPNEGRPLPCTTDAGSAPLVGP